SDQPSREYVLRYRPWSPSWDRQVMTQGCAITMDREFYFRHVVEKTMVAGQPLQAYTKGLARTYGIIQCPEGPRPNSFGYVNTQVGVLRQLNSCGPQAN